MSGPKKPTKPKKKKTHRPADPKKPADGIIGAPASATGGETGPVESKFHSGDDAPADRTVLEGRARNTRTITSPGSRPSVEAAYAFDPHPPFVGRQGAAAIRGENRGAGTAPDGAGAVG